MTEEERRREAEQIAEDLSAKAKASARKRRPKAANGEPEEQPKPKTNGSGERPEIVVRPGELHLCTLAGMAALGLSGVEFFQRSGKLVRVAKIKAKRWDGKEIMVPGIVAVRRPEITHALAHAAAWTKPKRRGASPTNPPKECAEQISCLEQSWPFSVLRGVIGTPSLRADGSVLTAAGYDERTGLYLLDPPPMPKIPEAPTRADAQGALADLNQLLREFKFADEIGEKAAKSSDQQVSRSVALSMLITPVVRGGMEVAPMHVVSKPKAGSGGSYLQDIAAAIAIGERCPVISLTSNAEENEKRLASAAINGAPIIGIDNVSQLLWGDFLCQVTERPRLSVRRLGGNDLAILDNTACVFANGNNLIVGGDNVRRTQQVLLDTDQENPEEREFDGDPFNEVLGNRGLYIRAALVIVRAYLVAGSPDPKKRKLSYEHWSDRVRSALCWLGMADPDESVTQLRKEDPIRGHQAAVFTAWAKTGNINLGYRTAELIKLAEDRRSQVPPDAELWDALHAVAAPRSGYQVIDPVKLGAWLRDNKHNIAGGHKLTVEESDPSRPRWKIVVHTREKAE